MKVSQCHFVHLKYQRKKRVITVIWEALIWLIEKITVFYSNKKWELSYCQRLRIRVVVQVLLDNCPGSRLQTGRVNIRWKGFTTELPFPNFISILWNESKQISMPCTSTFVASDQHKAKQKYPEKDMWYNMIVCRKVSLALWQNYTTPFTSTLSGLQEWKASKTNRIWTSLKTCHVEDLKWTVHWPNREKKEREGKQISTTLTFLTENQEQKSL